MISYLTKQFQAVPALMAVYQQVEGGFVTTRSTTKHAILDYQPGTSVSTYIEKLGSFSKGYKKLKDSQVIVTGAPYQTLLNRFNAKKYMIFTGTSAALTKRQVLEDHAHFDKLCVIGPRMLDVVKRSGVQVDVVQSGYFPFLSFPEKSQTYTHSVLKKMHLDPSKKTLAYLPRGFPKGSFDWVMPQLATKLNPKDYNIVVRPHPSQSVKLHVQDKIKFFRLKRQLSQFPHIFLDLNELQLSELLATADLVISDGNSPAEEALFYDMPQLLIETEEFNRDLLVENMNRLGSTEEDIVSALRIYDIAPSINPDKVSIKDAVLNALSESENFAEARKKHFEFAFGKRSFEAQHELIEELRLYAK